MVDLPKYSKSDLRYDPDAGYVAADIMFGTDLK